MNRDEIKFITLKTYNNLSNKNYLTVQELIYNAPTFQEELKIRNQLIDNHYDLSAILVVESIPTQKVEIIYKSHIYEDVKEVLLEIS